MIEDPTPRVLPRRRRMRSVILAHTFTGGVISGPYRAISATKWGVPRKAANSQKWACIRVSPLQTHLVAGTRFELVKLSRRIYSPLPLAARATCQFPSKDGGTRGYTDQGQPVDARRRETHGGQQF